MKSALIYFEGAADAPQPALGNRTPLQVARCPHAARLAALGQCGLLAPPKGGRLGRPEMLLAELLGVPLAEAILLHRGPLEAAGLREETAGHAFAYRGNFVTVDNGQLRETRVSNLSLSETEALAASLQNALDPLKVKLSPLAPGRVVALIPEEDTPLDPGISPVLVDGDIEIGLPQGRKGELVRRVMERSAAALLKLTVNDVRLDLGENPATHLWLWGGGPILSAPTFFRGSPRRAGALTQSPLLAGLAALAGMTTLRLGDIWSEQAAPPLDSTATRDLIAQNDFMIIGIEAPREGGHYGSPVEKVRLLERLDVQALDPVLKLLAEFQPLRVALLADDPAVGGDGHWPLILQGEGLAAGAAAHFDERVGRAGELGTLKAEQVCSWLAGDIEWR